MTKPYKDYAIHSKHTQQGGRGNFILIKIDGETFPNMMSALTYLRDLGFSITDANSLLQDLPEARVGMEI